MEKYTHQEFHHSNQIRVIGLFAPMVNPLGATMKLNNMLSSLQTHEIQKK